MRVMEGSLDSPGSYYILIIRGIDEDLLLDSMNGLISENKDFML